MSNTIFSIDPEATVKEAAKAMRKHGIRRLFVVPGGKGEGLIDKIPMGIISSGDIVMELARVKLH
jgi:CBS domain-containing protein